MNIDQQAIDLATRIQRRRDFSAHLTGFACGVVVLTVALLAGVSGTGLYLAALLAWATALSFQHFRQILRGPVTTAAVHAEGARLRRQHQQASTAAAPSSARPAQDEAGDSRVRTCHQGQASVAVHEVSPQPKNSSHPNTTGYQLAAIGPERLGVKPASRPLSGIAGSNAPGNSDRPLRPRSYYLESR